MSQLQQATRVEQPGKCWYTRREGVVRGPFTAKNISRHILLGRIHLDDELSQDRKFWAFVEQYTSLLPAGLTSQSGWDDYQRLVVGHMEVDERKGERRFQGCSNYLARNAERRTSPDRRREDENSLLNYYLYSGASSDGQGHSDVWRMRPMLLTVLLAVLVFVWLIPGQY